MPVAAERLVRNCSFVAPSPPRAGDPSLKQGVHKLFPRVTWEDVRGWGDPGYTHTASSMSIAAVPNASLESARERGVLLYVPELDGGRMWSAISLRDFWLFGEGACLESWTVTWCCSGCATEDFLKGDLKHAGQGPCVQLPCQQRDKI